MSTTTYVLGSGDERREITVTREGGNYRVRGADGAERIVQLGTSAGDGIRHVTIDGVTSAIGHVARGEGNHTVVLDGIAHDVELVDARLEHYRQLAGAGGGGAHHDVIKAPIPGLITEVKVEPGQTVAKDDTLVVLYAMKLENEIRAPADGTVSKVHVEPQQSVEKGALLVEMDE